VQTFKRRLSWPVSNIYIYIYIYIDTHIYMCVCTLCLSRNLRQPLKLTVDEKVVWKSDVQRLFLLLPNQFAPKFFLDVEAQTLGRSSDELVIFFEVV
jgi:hypothetical protein